MTDLAVWVCVSKTGNTLVFDSEPKKNSNNEWEGNLYVNSSMHTQIESLIKQSSMTHNSKPEQIVFTVK